MFRTARTRITRIIAGLIIAVAAAGVLTATPASAAVEDYGCSIEASSQRSASWGSATLYRTTSATQTIVSPPAYSIYAGWACSNVVAFSLTAAPGTVIEARTGSGFGQRLSELNGGASVQAYGTTSQGVTRGVWGQQGTEVAEWGIRVYQGSWYITLCDGAQTRRPSIPTCG